MRGDRRVARQDLGALPRVLYRLLAEEQREESRRIKDELRRERGHEQAKREYDTARRDRQRAKRR